MPEASVEPCGRQAFGVPVWPDFGAFRASGVRPDLLVIASPIAFHGVQTCSALELGVAVLCEKPVAATLDDVRRMRAGTEPRARRLWVLGRLSR